jgi:hypothetical protein
MKLKSKTFCFIILVCVFAGCKSNTPKSAADEYCQCMKERIKLDFKLRMDSCDAVVMPKYDLLNKFLARRYNPPPDTIDFDQEREVSKFGLAFLDSVENNCCKVAWGCQPDTTLSTD